MIKSIFTFNADNLKEKTHPSDGFKILFYENPTRIDKKKFKMKFHYLLIELTL